MVQENISAPEDSGDSEHMDQYVDGMGMVRAIESELRTGAGIIVHKVSKYGEGAPAEGVNAPACAR